MAIIETPSPDREQTDESLRKEREKADGGHVERQAAREQAADGVIRKARAQADAVLGLARDKADRQLEEADLPVATDSEFTAIAVERVLEDEALRHERAKADEVLRREREERARALARLLPLERDKTDLHLWTERARSDDALSHRDDFLGIVSHDLRNLLSGIVMSAGMLERDAPEGKLGDSIQEATGTILRYAARMNRLVGDLVDVVSIDAGKLAVAPIPGDCRSLIEEAVETFRASASRNQIDLRAETDGTPLPAHFDHDRMLQVLANLVSNALKFTSPGGRVSVSGERDGGEVSICVRDTGLGVPAPMLEVIFERFWQVGKSDRRGLGLGLYISRCIVEAHGGRIWAESDEGNGSRFRFTIPVGSDRAAAAR